VGVYALKKIIGSIREKVFKTRGKKKKRSTGGGGKIFADSIDEKGSKGSKGKGLRMSEKETLHSWREDRKEKSSWQCSPIGPGAKYASVVRNWGMKRKRRALKTGAK